MQPTAISLGTPGAAPAVHLALSCSGAGCDIVNDFFPGDSVPLTLRAAQQTEPNNPSTELLSNATPLDEMLAAGESGDCDRRMGPLMSDDKEKEVKGNSVQGEWGAHVIQRAVRRAAFLLGTACGDGYVGREPVVLMSLPGKRQQRAHVVATSKSVPGDLPPMVGLFLSLEQNTRAIVYPGLRHKHCRPGGPVVFQWKWRSIVAHAIHSGGTRCTAGRPTHFLSCTGGIILMCTEVTCPPVGTPDRGTFSLPPRRPRGRIASE